MNLKILILLSIVFSSCTHNSKLQGNKDVVKNFYEMAANEKQPRKAVELFVGQNYKQHNPYAGDGKEAFITFFEARAKEYPEARMEIKRSIAEGDLVVVHVHSKLNPSDRGRAIVDIFRVENGKVVEHWDVVQDIPEKAANTNTMF